MGLGTGWGIKVGNKERGWGGTRSQESLMLWKEREKETKVAEGKPFVPGRVGLRVHLNPPPRNF